MRAVQMSERVDCMLEAGWCKSVILKSILCIIFAWRVRMGEVSLAETDNRKNDGNSTREKRCRIGTKQLQN